MLKINNIKIDVNTNNGLFGAFHTFTSGLNIVRGNNTSGKSSLFQAIVYALGFEELIGGRFEKTMQSVLKDQVEYPKHTFHSVLQSFILLEIENANGDIITIRRFVQNPNRKSQLIDVFFGSLLANESLESRPMFIHDNGGASDENYGFHLYLEEFLNWKLPKVLTNKGELRKIYIQQIASSFIIEQKSGWSDFFATMPIYGLNNKEARIVEFILDMDVYGNKMKKQELGISKRILENDWLNLNRQFERFAEKGGGKLTGLSQNPMIINNLEEINILLSKDETDYSISNYFYSGELDTKRRHYYRGSSSNTPRLSWMAGFTEKKFGANGFYSSPAAIDQYEETIKKEGNRFKYKYGKEWRNVTEKTVSIAYKKGKRYIIKRAKEVRKDRNR